MVFSPGFTQFWWDLFRPRFEKSLEFLIFQTFLFSSSQFIFRRFSTREQQIKKIKCRETLRVNVNCILAYFGYAYDKLNNVCREI